MKFSLSKHFTTASAFRTQRSLNALAVLLFVVALFPLRIHAQIDAEMVTNMGRNALSVDDYLTAIHYFNQAIESKPFCHRLIIIEPTLSLRLRIIVGQRLTVIKVFRSTPSLLKCINCVAFVVSMLTTFKGR